MKISLNTCESTLLSKQSVAVCHVGYINLCIYYIKKNILHKITLCYDFLVFGKKTTNMLPKP